MWPNRKIIGGMFSPAVLGEGGGPVESFDYGEAIPSPMDWPLFPDNLSVYTYAEGEAAATIGIESVDANPYLLVVIYRHFSNIAITAVAKAAGESDVVLDLLDTVSYADQRIKLYRCPPLTAGLWEVEFSIQTGNTIAPLAIALFAMSTLPANFEVLDTVLQQQAQVIDFDYTPVPIAVGEYGLAVFISDSSYLVPQLTGNFNNGAEYINYGFTGPETGLTPTSMSSAWFEEGGAYTVIESEDTAVLSFDFSGAPLEGHVLFSISVYVPAEGIITLRTTRADSEVDEFIWTNQTGEEADVLLSAMPRPHTYLESGGIDLPAINSMEIEASHVGTSISSMSLASDVNLQAIAIGIDQYNGDAAWSADVFASRTRLESHEMFAVFKLGEP